MSEAVVGLEYQFNRDVARVIHIDRPRDMVKWIPVSNKVKYHKPRECPIWFFEANAEML